PSRHRGRRAPPRSVRRPPNVPSPRRPPGRQRERGDPRKPPRRGTPRFDPPEPLHPIPVRPLDRGTSVGGGEARPPSDRARGRTPNRSRDGPPLITISGNPAALVRARGPSVRLDDRSEEHTSELQSR